MGILDDDVARVRDATDLVALAGEHLGAEACRQAFHRAVPVPRGEDPVVQREPGDGALLLPGRRDARHHLGRRQADPRSRGNVAPNPGEPWTLARCHVPLVRCPAADEDHAGLATGWSRRSTPRRSIAGSFGPIEVAAANGPPRSFDLGILSRGRFRSVGARSDLASRRSASRTGSRLVMEPASRMGRVSTSTARSRPNC